MNIGRAVGDVMQFSQELDILHKHISKRELPVQKRDSFDEQCIFLEEYLGGDTYKKQHKKMQMLNLLSGVVAFPILFLIVAIVVYSKMNKDFDVFRFIMENPFTYITAGILLLGVLVLALSFTLAKKKLYNKIYPDLKAKLKIEA